MAEDEEVDQDPQQKIGQMGQRSNQDETMNRDKSINVSVRQRREQKKLQKYDSNSIDEEEF
jgi:hypothetical protein